MYDLPTLADRPRADALSRAGSRRKAVNDKFVILLLAATIVGGVYYFIEEIFGYIHYLRILWGV